MQVMLAHDPPDSIITDITQGFGNQAAIPARESLRRRFGQLIKNSPFDGLIVDYSAPTALFILLCARSLFPETGDTIITEEVRKFPTPKVKEIGVLSVASELRREEVLRIRKRCADNR